MLDSPLTTPTGRAEQPLLRLLGTSLLAIAAGIHVIETVSASPLGLGVAFVLSALGLTVAFLLLVGRAPRLGWLLGGVSALMTLVAYCVTRTVGIPYLDPNGDLGNWLEPLGVVSLVVEGGVVIVAILALTDRHRLSVRHAVAELKATAPGVDEAASVPSWAVVYHAHGQEPTEGTVATRYASRAVAEHAAVHRQLAEVDDQPGRAWSVVPELLMQGASES